MKKILFTLILSMAFITASFHAQVKKLVIRENKVCKNIDMAISANNNYSSNAYKYCEARIDYTVIKVKGAHIDTLMQKQFLPFKLKELPSFAKEFNEQIAIKDVSERKEQIWISYTVTYSSKGSVLCVNHEQLVPKGVEGDSIRIHI
ncbi:hypothetical protein OCK74_21060 [Chitinophagaceae bacterium LB-8]|uniref:Uncharacterized protein n=1 Tax=Paraflavisolibacter caeni TaxID=2982496 RepID=A0A9X2XPL2_9BACT|nr:hypothetical protein [Paraflavisolibacter caeni]MCU7551623.1 hypothetical protein [Paraflavisolibacter caeni]